MRQLVFLGPGRAEWQEAPEPAIGGAIEAITAATFGVLDEIDREIDPGA